MENKVVGKVTVAEKDELLEHFQRKNALIELSRSLNLQTPDQKELYEKIVTDLGEANYNVEQWWKTKGQMYQWEGRQAGQWLINFDTCEIILIDKNDTHSET
jgi:CXXX repeat modification system protein